MTKNLIGQRFGRWTVIRIAEKRKNGNSGTMVYWECLCDCGNKKNVVTHVLIRGSSKSCGCLRREGHKILPRRVSNINLLLRNYKNGAERRGLEFSLNIEEFEDLIQQDCFYCGIPPQTTLKARWLDGTFVYNGIDRWDNDLGYVEGNVVTCCKRCNYAKHTMSGREFFEWATRISNNWINRINDEDGWKKFLPSDLVLDEGIDFNESFNRFERCIERKQ